MVLKIFRVDSVHCTQKSDNGIGLNKNNYEYIYAPSIALDIETVKRQSFKDIIYSSFFYILRLLIKMTLSSYHLASDAQERHQLTYQYLSLLQAKVIEEKDREIILQSLFSRADTGLLKGDSSPTMPDGLLGQIVKNIGS